MKRRNRSPFPHWSQEKLQRYDAAWARVFSGREAGEIPRFSPPKQSSPAALEPLALGEWRAQLILRRLAALLRRYSRPLTALAEDKLRLAQAQAAYLQPLTGFRLPDRAQPPAGKSPGERLRLQQQAELERAAAYDALHAQSGHDPVLAALAQRGALLARQTAQALAQIESKQ